MKHRIAALAAMTAVAGAVSAGPAVAQTATLPKLTSTLTKTVTTKVTRTSIRFTTKGKVTFSKAPRLPAGTTDPAYAVAAPTNAQACKGTVRITEYRGSKLLVRKTLQLKSNCTYSTSTTIKRSIAYGRVFVRGYFAGNSVLKADAAPASARTYTKPKK